MTKPQRQPSVPSRSTYFIHVLKLPRPVPSSEYDVLIPTVFSEIFPHLRGVSPICSQMCCVLLSSDTAPQRRPPRYDLPVALYGKSLPGSIFTVAACLSLIRTVGITAKLTNDRYFENQDFTSDLISPSTAPATVDHCPCEGFSFVSRMLCSGFLFLWRHLLNLLCYIL